MEQDRPSQITNILRIIFKQEKEEYNINRGRPPAQGTEGILFEHFIANGLSGSRDLAKSAKLGGKITSEAFAQKYGAAGLTPDDVINGYELMKKELRQTLGETEYKKYFRE